MTALLLTGASGLVGSRLLPRLVEDGFECRALIRCDVALPPGTAGVRGDLADPGTLRAAVEGVDAVVHLAALFRTQDEDAIWRANRDGTRNLIAAVQEHAPGARLIMSSTGNVYNADATRPALETDACSPTAAYPASKVAAEQLLRVSGLTWAVLRLPFVYGEGDGHLASIHTLAPQFGMHPAQSYAVPRHRGRRAPRADRGDGRPDRQRHRRRPGHHLRDGPPRRPTDRGVGRAAGQPVVRAPRRHPHP